MGYQRDIIINAPIETVWKSWTSEVETSKWLAPKSHIIFEEGKPYEFFWDEDPEIDSTIGCTLLKIETWKKLRFEWQGKSEFLDMFMSPHRKTIIEVSFLNITNGIKVIVNQEETRDLEKWDEYDKWMADAWEYALTCLKTYCEESHKKIEEMKDCC
ncbi:MAG: SRPBCC domain-containing protein [Candidatus Marinimicrobia bacterium]|nr:SRPBCC domain-containing protein [Candidatus Neomarinimicrobiota bacterium]